MSTNTTSVVVKAVRDLERAIQTIAEATKAVESLGVKVTLTIKNNKVDYSVEDNMPVYRGTLNTKTSTKTELTYFNSP